MAKKSCKKAKKQGFILGGLSFIAISYIAHCKYSLGPWRCQRADGRRNDAK